MQKFFSVLVVLGVLGLIVFFGILGNSSTMRNYSNFKNNLEKTSKISFSKIGMMPEKLGGKETTVLKFQAKTTGPGTFFFGQGDDIQITLSAKNNSSEAMSGKVGCMLRDGKNPATVYATVNDWTAEIDGSGIKANSFETGNLHFKNFGTEKRPVITLEPNRPLTFEVVCDTSNFHKSSNPSTLRASIRIPGSIIYSLNDIVALKSRFHSVGTSGTVFGLPVQQSELSTS